MFGIGNSNALTTNAGFGDPNSYQMGEDMFKIGGDSLG